MTKTAGFYIDSTEVTVGQYAAFLKAKGDDTSGQASECSWNTAYDPALDPIAPAPSAKHPVTNVDYCDAVAFCAWADKRLCGKIGGGNLQLPEIGDATKSQWFEACSGTKGQLYPYGTSYQDGACNDASGALMDVAAEARCQGFYPGLYDMIGNAQEWIDACDGNAGATDVCERIGGSYLNEVSMTSCGTTGGAMRNLQAPSVGFRCCSK
jgi:formylglycine-generating enzyme required for sulfatase activity